MEEKEKLARLRELLLDLGRVLIAYSGGVDSAFLYKVAVDTLGKEVLAVTASSETYPAEELEAATAVAQALGGRHLIIKTQELALEEFAGNPPERCYHCKKELYSRLWALAREQSIPWIIDGANWDDRNDFRPGKRAGLEMGVRSPLWEVGLTKKEIRSLSRQLGLPTWNKPSMACLSSRIPYGQPITMEKLRQIEKGERLLRELGLSQLRVRHHGTVARLEVLPEEFSKLWESGRREVLLQAFKELGFTYVTLDLEGFRSGSMNEVLAP